MTIRKLEVVKNIKAIFLDIGGVILSDGWGHKSRQKAAEVFRFDYKKMNNLHQFIFSTYEIGNISLEQYLDTILFYQSRDFTKEEFAKYMFSQSIELPNMLSWLKDWKNQIKLPVFALNNEPKDLNDYRIEKFSLHKLFDGFFSSCSLGFRKPDPKIYQIALKIAHVNPEESLYFDDRPGQLTIAKKLGFQVVHHQSFKETQNILKTFLSN